MSGSSSSDAEAPSSSASYSEGTTKKGSKKGGASKAAKKATKKGNDDGSSSEVDSAQFQYEYMAPVIYKGWPFGMKPINVEDVRKSLGVFEYCVIFIGLVIIAVVAGVGGTYVRKVPSEDEFTSVIINKESMDDYLKSTKVCLAGYRGMIPIVNTTYTVNTTTNELMVTESFDEFEVLCTPVVLTWKAYVTIFTIAYGFVAMVAGVAPDVAMLGVTIILNICGIITANDSWQAFSNPGVVSIATLFAVAKAVEETAVVETVMRPLLRKYKSTSWALFVMGLPIGIASAVLLNTPIVAVMIPIIVAWTRRLGMSPSKFLMPLSFITMLGGMLSIIGSSTNLIVVGLVEKAVPGFKVGFFFPAVGGGIPFVAGLLFVCLAAPFVLPDRVTVEGKEETGSEESDDVESRPTYDIKFTLIRGNTMMDDAFSDCEVTQHPEAKFVHVLREDGTVVKPSEYSTERPQVGDRYKCRASVEGVLHLRHVAGLAPSAPYNKRPVSLRLEGVHAEVIVSPKSTLIGSTIDHDEFYEKFNGVVLAIRKPTRHADVDTEVIEAGDCLLCETIEKTARAWKRSGDEFSLVSIVPNSRSPIPVSWLRVQYQATAGLLIVPLVLLVVFEIVGLETLCFLYIGACIRIGIFRLQDALNSIPIRTILAIGFSFGMGSAVDKTGLAQVVSTAIVNAALPIGQGAVLGAIALVTAVLTAVLNANGVVVIMAPLIVSAWKQTPDISIEKYMAVLMLAAANCYITPIGFQTNLMVMAPGRYTFGDFARLGLPLEIIVQVLLVICTVFFYK